MDKPLWARLCHAATRVEARLEAACGMSLAWHGVLGVLAGSAEPLALTELAQRLSCVKSNVTQLVNRLEAEGLVERRDDVVDKRCKRAALTVEGRRRWEASNAALEGASAALLGEFSGEERELLRRLLEKL